MSLEAFANDPTLPQAMAALKSASAELDAKHPDPKPDSASTPATAPLEEQTEETPPPDTKPGDAGAPATTEKPSEPEKTEPVKPDAKKQSDYAKNEERKAKTWKELNAEKEAIRAEAAKIKQERESWERERLAEAKKRELASKEYERPPEFYEQGAKTLEAQAKAAEDNADFDLAAEKRVRAKDCLRLAKELRERQPDPTAEQTKQAFDAEQKKWTAKAGIDFPELAKRAKDADGKEIDSPAMAKLKALITPGSDGYDQIVHEAVNTSPAGWYYAARLAHSETVAARVPTLEKDLADSRAEVKKLNGKLSVNGGGLATTQPKAPDFKNMPVAEQERYLREQARTQRL